MFLIGPEWSQGTLPLNCYLIYFLCSCSPIPKDLVETPCFGLQVCQTCKDLVKTCRDKIS